MTSLSPLTDSFDWRDEPDAEALVPEAIVLSEAQVVQATRLAWPHPEDQQWAVYLNGLALLGVQQWLQEAYLPQTVRCVWTEAGIRCRLGRYHLQVVALTSVADATVDLLHPSRQIDDAPIHLYILAEVQEELAQVTVRAGLRHDQLQAFIASSASSFLPAECGAECETVSVPLSAFQCSPMDLLLYLRCLDAAAIAPSPCTTEPASSWEQPWINVSHWFNHQLDQTAQALSWYLLPPLAAATALKSPTEVLESVLSDLEPLGVAIPPRARGACTEIGLGGLTLQLYALTWTIFHPEQPPEWSLFLVLGAQPGDALPAGTRLMVADAEAVMVTTVADATDSHLYAQVYGTWTEAFTVTLALPGGPQQTLPAFVYQPETP